MDQNVSLKLVQDLPQTGKTTLKTIVDIQPTNIPPSMSYFNGGLWLSVPLHVDGAMRDVRIELEPHTAAFLLSQGAKSISAYLAYTDPRSL